MPIDYGSEEITKEEIETAKKTALKREPKAMMTHEQTEELWQTEEEARAMQEEIKAAKRAGSPLGKFGRFLGRGKEEGEAVYKGILAGQHPEYETPESYPQKSRQGYSTARSMTKRLIGVEKELKRDESWFKKSMKELIEPVPAKKVPKTRKFRPEDMYFTDYTRHKKAERPKKPREKPLISEPLSYFKKPRGEHPKQRKRKHKRLRFGYMKDGRFIEVKERR